MTFEQITQILSRQNNKAKAWLKLKTSQGVKKQNLILIEGIRFCLSALHNDAEIESFLFVDNPVGKKLFGNFQQLIQTKMPSKSDDFNANSFRIDELLFQSIANAKHAQGVIFIVRKPKLWTLSAWLNEKKTQGSEKLVLLDKIADPGNLGTIIRTADAFNYAGLILKKGSVDPYIPKVLRSTMGSLFALDLIEIVDYKELSPLQNDYHIKLLISDMNGISLSRYDTMQISKGHVLAIGNEAHGIDADLRYMADDIISIPMPGNTESLNAAIAFAIIAYQLEQQSQNNSLK